MMRAESIEQSLRRRFPAIEQVDEKFLVVGGAIRDLLLALSPIDVDFVGKDARGEAERFASRTGGRLVELGREPLATWRIATGRRLYDFTEQIGGSIEADLGRRDFTINAIALDRAEPRLIDPFGGAAAIDRREIAVVRDQNLTDDPLRMLRAVRFAATYGFGIESRTHEAIRNRADDISLVAPERVHGEMKTIIGSRRAAEALELMEELRLDLPLIGGAPCADVLAALRAVPEPDSLLGFSILLHSRSGEEIEAFAVRWRWSTAARRTIARAVALFQALQGSDREERDLVILLYDAGEVAARLASRMLRAFGEESRSDPIDEILERRARDVFTPTPLLGGAEIGKLTGIPVGPEIGRLKRALVEAQLRGDVHSEEEAVTLVRTLGGSS
ncbi:MAG TPA: hypothetical protein VMT00_04285 [Thermoanaerobaculia bacterium]|nr:hypothetical protein [Thermoanaerobaculia bacterium]